MSYYPEPEYAKGYGAGAQNEAAVRIKSPLDEASVKLEAALDFTGVQLGQLTAKLEPVLRHTGPAEKEASSPRPAGASPLVEGLQRVTEIVESYNKRLVDLNNRCVL